MAFEADAPPRARRPVVIALVLFGAAFIALMPMSLIQAFAPIDYVRSAAWEVLRLIFTIGLFATMIASFVFMYVGARILRAAKKEQEDEAARIRQSLIDAGQPPAESYPSDSRPDTRKYTVATTVFLFATILTPNVTLLLMMGVSRLPLTDAVKELILWALIGLGAVVTVGSFIALFLVGRARNNENAMWEIEQREAREKHAARQTDTLPEAGPTLPG